MLLKKRRVFLEKDLKLVEGGESLYRIRENSNGYG